MWYKKIVLLIGLIIGGSTVFAQQMPGFSPNGGQPKANPVRKFLNMFSLGLSAGYGQSFYQHTLDPKQHGGFYIMKREDDLYLAFKNNKDQPVYTNWTTALSKDSVTLNGMPGDVAYSYDSTAFTFRQSSQNVPIHAVLYFDWKKIRLGAGAALEYQKFSKVFLNHDQELLGDFQEVVHNFAYRYYLSAGYNFYTFKTLVFDYHFIADFQLGMYNYGTAFDVPEGNTNPYFNLGVTAEKQLSEYFRIFIRPSLEYKRYAFEPVESENPMLNKNYTYYVQTGVFLKFPEVKRCPINACHIQIKHKHFGKQYRGQPIHKKQNRRYGENNRTLLKYKKGYKGK